MVDFVKQILTGQFAAALCMLNDCIEKCSPEHWGRVIGKYPFWQVVYHTLCFVDLYLSPDEKTFQVRDGAGASEPVLHPAGWKEFD